MHEHNSEIDKIPDLEQAAVAAIRVADFESAYRLMDRVLSRTSNNPHAVHLSTMAVVQRKRHQLESALRLIEAAVATDPNYAGAYNNYGMILDDLGRSEEAFRAFETAVNLHQSLPQPHAAAEDQMEARMNLGRALLKSGRHEEGWRLMEIRYDRSEWKSHYAPQFSQPLWRGEDLNGKSLLCVPEGGLGDTLMFSRFIPEIRRRFPEADILFVPQRPLTALYSAIFPDMLRACDSVPESDYFIPLQSLPFCLGHDFLPEPYLLSDATKTRAIKDQLPPAALRIGLSWQGNPAFPGDWCRSLPLRLLAPLADIPGLQFLALQQNFGREQIKDWPGPIAQMPIGADFTDTAAAMSCCDLVIASDSALCHLAGALGRPVWALLGVDAEWRWLTKRRDSPWYPTMRLFRQKTPGDWHGVVGDVRVALCERLFLSGSAATHPPDR